MTTGSAQVSVPPPVVPPRGLVGLLEGYDPSKLLDTSQYQANQVFLNVYDLGDNDSIHSINNVSTGNNNLLIGGMFHAGVQVFGQEWCFGFTQAGTGVAPVVPRAHPRHKYRTTVPLGCTALGEQEVSALLERMSAEWPGDQYDLLHRNCLNFCNALCQELGAGRVPSWVDRAPRAASEIDSACRTAAEGARAVAETVASALPEARPTLPSNAEEAHRAAEEALETVTREAQKALESAHAESARLAGAAQELAGAAQPIAAQAVEAAQAQAQELRQAAEPVVAEVVAEVQAIGEEVHAHARRFSQQAQELLREDVAQARELAEKTGVQARTVGAELWQRAQAAWAAAEASAAAAAAEVEKAVNEPASSAAPGSWSGNWEATIGGLLTNLGMSDADVDFKCPQSHLLRPWQARAGTCDGCARAVKDGEQVMDCRLCDFYYCADCVQALQGPPTSPAPVGDSGPRSTAWPIEKATPAGLKPAPAPIATEGASAATSPAQPAQIFSLSPRNENAEEEDQE